MKRIDKIIIGIGGTIIAACIGSLGVMMNNQAVYGPPPIEKKQDEKSFNNFDKYIGSHKSRITVEAFLKELYVYNLNLELKEQITYVGPSQEEIKIFKADQNFTILVTKYNDDGQIAEITVTVE